jgi:isoamylase
MKKMYQIEPGAAHPPGAVPDEQGVNFSIFSQHATSVELLLFARQDDPEPVQVIPLDPMQHRTYHCWHVYVRGLKTGIHYAYRFEGPHDLHGRGDRFNRNKVVLDPYARGITTTLWRRSDALGPDDNLHTCMRCTVVDVSGYDWQGDRPLKKPMSETIIYEMHVGGFTRSPSSGCHSPGTFAGVIEKIPYLKALGITAVELMPIFAFDEQGNRFLSPVDGQPLKNYWGYDPICHFALHPAYGLSPTEGDHVRDFRDMVKALHKAGIEVILDVVFNHSGEGDHLGPTISFKGIDNSIYYDLDPKDRQYYVDYSGCGNTFKCNHPVVAKLIAECLEYWVEEMHVDGFRLDEASVLVRGGDGRPIKYPPVLWHIELNERLADTKFFVEAWDAAGLYQVGNFPIYRWSEWNGRYRDVIRRFVRGDPGMVDSVATCIAGSADLYQETERMPINSLNFITCHDGFTLNDLVTYNHKRNKANGEENRDGSDANWSWNCGVEGETSDRAIEALRQRQIKNFLAILMLSQGIPLLLAGDEIRRTQRGNNNAYCQDNEISWIDWRLVEKNGGLFRFFKLMIAFRKHHPNVRRKHFFTGKPNEHGMRDIDWHSCRLFSPDWHDSDCHLLAFTIWGLSQDDDLHVMLNMGDRGLDFEVPALEGRSWLKVIDTALPSPMDIAEPGKETAVPANMCFVDRHSVVVLICRRNSLMITTVGGYHQS